MLLIYKLLVYSISGVEMASTGSWPSAPKEAFIVGLKELPESKDPVIHRHIFYAHAYKVGPWLFYMRIKPFILQHQYMCS